MTIRLVASIRQNPGPEPIKGPDYRGVSGLIQAAYDQRANTRLVRLHTDSAATVWVEVDGRRINVDDILMCPSRAEQCAVAAKMLAP